MNFVRWASCLVLAGSMLTSGCAVNRATASVDPSADLSSIKTIHVVHAVEDGRNINEIISQRLNQLGFVATTGDAVRKDVDAVVTYVDRWMWDITMYMIDLTVTVRDPKSNFPMATGNSHHTSLTRQSPKEMVAEVTGNIFKNKDAKK